MPLTQARACLCRWHLLLRCCAAQCSAISPSVIRHHARQAAVALKEQTGHEQRMPQWLDRPQGPPCTLMACGTRRVVAYVTQHIASRYQRFLPTLPHTPPDAPKPVLGVRRHSCRSSGACIPSSSQASWRTCRDAPFIPLRAHADGRSRPTFLAPIPCGGRVSPCSRPAAARL